MKINWWSDVTNKFLKDKKTRQFNISVIPIGHKVIAVDLPGYGKSSKYDGDRGEFLIKLIKTLSPNVKPILVSPSMSGTFSLPLLNKEPDLICGYIPGIYITRFQSAQLQQKENSMDSSL